MEKELKSVEWDRVTSYKYVPLWYGMQWQMNLAMFK
jgi:hypothetical protein